MSLGKMVIGQKTWLPPIIMDRWRRNRQRLSLCSLRFDHFETLQIGRFERQQTEEEEEEKKREREKEKERERGGGDSQNRKG
jgi:hypothetical protein